MKLAEAAGDRLHRLLCVHVCQYNAIANIDTNAAAELLLLDWATAKQHVLESQSTSWIVRQRNVLQEQFGCTFYFEIKISLEKTVRLFKMSEGFFFLLFDFFQNSIHLIRFCYLFCLTVISILHQFTFFSIHTEL